MTVLIPIDVVVLISNSSVEPRVILESTGNKLTVLTLIDAVVLISNSSLAPELMGLLLLLMLLL